MNAGFELEPHADRLAARDAALLADLVALRKQRRLTQAEVADRMGVSQPAVAQFERDDANPQLSTIRRYAVAVGANIVHHASATDVNSQAQRMCVYIDGFNLYRRLLEKRPGDKWLDLEALARHCFPEYELVQARYFTAIIKTLPGADPAAPQRQQAYLRALETQPRTSTHLGKFRIDPRIMPVHPGRVDANGNPITVSVKKTEEKGSDVSLASHLLLDAFKDRADLYVLCSNDSDLVTPLRLAREELGVATALLSPMEPKRSSNELKQHVSVHRQITTETLAASQLPDVVHDDHGRRITRPASWTWPAKNTEGPAEAGPSNQ